MNAVEFIRKFGWEHTKYLLEDTELSEFAIHSNCAGKHFMDTVSVSDLKCYVDAYGLVESFSIIGLCAPENNYNQCLDYEKFGGLLMAKRELAEAIKYNSEFIEVILDNEITLIKTERLKQAIALVQEI